MAVVCTCGPVDRHTYLCFPCLDLSFAMTSRESSSIYSDSFELEDLVNRISKAADSQDTFTIKALETERDCLRQNVNSIRNTWDAIESLMADLEKISQHILLLCRRCEQNKETEGKKWMANFTVI